MLETPAFDELADDTTWGHGQGVDDVVTPAEGPTASNASGQP